jgi:CO/xanthine dehydrogenase Mo-binding subunit
VPAGDAEAALAGRGCHVEGSFATAFVEHAYIEPEAGWRGCVGRPVEVACLHPGAGDGPRGAGRIWRRRAPGADRAHGVGGGFGSKLDLSVQPYLALAALQDGRPCGWPTPVRNRWQTTTKRHPARSPRGSARRDGRLHRHDLRGAFNTGAYASWGPTVANRVPVHASGPYRIADYRAEARAVHTHCPPSGAFRGFGVPQAAVAQEQPVRRAGRRLGLDRLEFRILNALRKRRSPRSAGRSSKAASASRLPRGAAPGLGRRGPRRRRGTRRQSSLKGRRCARRGRGGRLVRLRQHLAAQPLDHQGGLRATGRCAASGRGGYRPGVEHRDRADLRRRRSACR